MQKKGLKPSLPHPNLKLKPFTNLFLIFLFLTFLVFTLTFRLNPCQNHVSLSESNGCLTAHHVIKQNPRWYDVISHEIKSDKLKVGLVNLEGKDFDFESIAIEFDRVAEYLKWEDFFPEWIDEDEKFGKAPVCPKIPMPEFDDYYAAFDVIVAEIPCGSRDVFRLQVNLVVANLAVRIGGVDRTVYVVFVGSCGPMVEIFRCDDMAWDGGDHWVYKPDLWKLKVNVMMPVGSCQLAAPVLQSGYEEKTGRRKSLELQNSSVINNQREAYVTVLHSSESYVCGAIALAQSIIKTNSTKQLLLLADHSISSISIKALKSAGWKIKRIRRIRSPRAQRGAYNEWNYSKLRMWQQTEYDKLVFIDSDLIVLKNMDHLFNYPQLSAIRNDRYIFNSGLMLVEPSECMFKTMMKKRFELGSYNGGDQGFLNEIFVWWHRLPWKLNYLKVFQEMSESKHEIPGDLYGIHYLGLKPWMCNESHDCNWDKEDHHIFASNSAHKKWWEIHRGMTKELKSFCGLGRKMEERLRKPRQRSPIKHARQNSLVRM